MLMEARLLDERREGIAEGKEMPTLLLLSVFSAWAFLCRISPRLLLSRLNRLKHCKLSSNHKLKLIL